MKISNFQFRRFFRTTSFKFIRQNLSDPCGCGYSFRLFWLISAPCAQSILWIVVFVNHDDDVFTLRMIIFARKYEAKDKPLEVFIDQ
jgi:hypothetical protein